MDLTQRRRRVGRTNKLAAHQHHSDKPASTRSPPPSSGGGPPAEHRFAGPGQHGIQQTALRISVFKESYDLRTPLVTYRLPFTAHCRSSTAHHAKNITTKSLPMPYHHAGVGVAGAGTFCSKPEPPEHLARDRSRRNILLGAAVGIGAWMFPRSRNRSRGPSNTVRALHPCIRPHRPLLYHPNHLKFSTSVTARHHQSSANRPGTETHQILART